MNFLDKVSKHNWTANESWKLERELEAARCFIPNGPSTAPSTSSFADLFSKDILVPIHIPKPPPKTYIPGKVFFPKDIDSALTKKQQALSLGALQYYQSNPESRVVTKLQQSNIQESQIHQSQIQEENVKFLKYVEEDWKKKSQARTNKIKPAFSTYARRLWNQKLRRCLTYPQFYKSLTMISLVDSPPVEVNRVEEVAQFGKIAEFSPPSFLLRFITKPCSLPNEEGNQTYNSKLPVSQDDNITELLTNRDVDVVLSSSALKLLMDNSDYNISWTVPIVVKQHEVKQANGTVQKKNVVYIDKPFARRILSNVDLNVLAHKRLVRTNFCIFPKVIYPNSETLRPNPFCTEESTLDEAMETTTTLPLYNKLIQHNVSYDIWSMNVKNEENHLMKTKAYGKEIKILIRYKLDACECLSNGEMRPLVIVQKLEYQLEHGASVATKSELIRQWTSLFFRPFSHLYRVRIQSENSEVISIESVNLQKINTDAINHYNDKPYLRLGALYKILSQLTTLEAGNYLLDHIPNYGPFAKILKSQDDSCKSNSGSKPNIFDLHSEYRKENCKVVRTPIQWCPIDVHYILPVHATYKRMPGMFKPLLNAKKLAMARRMKQQNKKNGAKQPKKKKQKTKAKQAV